MRSSHLRQRGMSMFGIVAILAVASFIALFAFKVGPAYLEYWTVAKIADDIQADSDLLQKPRSKIMVQIDKAYRTNNLWDMSAKETMILEKDKSKGYIVKVQYEKRANLIHNIDLVTVFSKTAGTP